MKNAKLGDYMLWSGEPAKVIAETSTPMVLVEIIKENKCPHCGGSLENYKFWVIVTSPLFQQNAEPMPTLS